MLLTVFDVESLKIQIEEKQKESVNPEIFTNPALCSQINKDLKLMTNKVEKLDKLQNKVADLKDFIDMCEIEGDESMLGDNNRRALSPNTSFWRI